MQSKDFRIVDFTESEHVYLFVSVKGINCIFV